MSKTISASLVNATTAVATTAGTTMTFITLCVNSSCESLSGLFQLFMASPLVSRLGEKDSYM
jgi:hypothetical protein